MTAPQQDILVDIPDEDLPELLAMYEKHKDWATTAYGTIATGIEWRKKSKEKYTMFMSPHGCWREDGTFFVQLTKYCFDTFIFSLDDSGKNIYEGLLKTNRLDPGEYKDKDPWLYCVHYKFYPTVLRAIKDKGWTLTSEIVCDMYSIAREQALRFEIECPPDVYLKPLDPKVDAGIIGSSWPHSYKNCDKFISFLIEMNGGIGVFLKSTNELVSWVLLSMMGQLVILQTANGHQKKGYASLVTKYMSKKLAERGYNAFGTVKYGNVSSKIMFEKIGFTSLGEGTYALYKT